MYNRLKLNEYSEEVFEKALINRSTIAVEILDIDYFKQYNDNYGHQAGDDCIKFIADTLSNLAKDEGIFAARYGGDEFVVIYEGMTKEMVEAKVIELRERVYEAKWEHKFSLADDIVTISQGICFGVPERDASMFGYLQTADRMLYEVKQQSRNNYKICEV